MKLIFLHADKHESFLQIDIMMGIVKHSQNSKFAMSLQCLKKEVRDEVDFLHGDKHQSFLQVDYNTLGIKVSYKVILSLLMDMIKHSQSTKRDGVLFLQTSKFLQVGIIVFDGSGQICPKYPK